MFKEYNKIFNTTKNNKINISIKILEDIYNIINNNKNVVVDNNKEYNDNSMMDSNNNSKDSNENNITTTNHINHTIINHMNKEYIRLYLKIIKYLIKKKKEYKIIKNIENNINIFYKNKRYINKIIKYISNSNISRDIILFIINNNTSDKSGGIGDSDNKDSNYTTTYNNYININIIINNIKKKDIIWLIDILYNLYDCNINYFIYKILFKYKYNVYKEYIDNKDYSNNSNTIDNHITNKHIKHITNHTNYTTTEIIKHLKEYNQLLSYKYSICNINYNYMTYTNPKHKYNNIIDIRDRYINIIKNNNIDEYIIDILFKYIIYEHNNINAINDSGNIDGSIDVNNTDGSYNDTNSNTNELTYTNLIHNINPIHNTNPITNHIHNTINTIIDENIKNIYNSIKDSMRYNRSISNNNIMSIIEYGVNRFNRYKIFWNKYEEYVLEYGDEIMYTKYLEYKKLYYKY